MDEWSFHTNMNSTERITANQNGWYNPVNIPAIMEFNTSNISITA